MATRVFKLNVVTMDSKESVEVRCHVDGNVLSDVTLVGSEAKESIAKPNESVLARLDPTQRESILKRLSKRLGVEIVVPHIRKGQLASLNAAAKKQEPKTESEIAVDNCDHHTLSALSFKKVEYDGKVHITIAQLRCLNCGGNFEPCTHNNYKFTFHRMGQPCE